jgi:hypothetical protein
VRRVIPEKPQAVTSAYRVSQRTAERTSWTFFGSSKIAAASARQKSVSNPVQFPCASGRQRTGARSFRLRASDT